MSKIIETEATSTTIAHKLRIDLKLTRHIRAHEVDEYAHKFGIIPTTNRLNRTYYIWTEEQYKELIKIFEP